LKPGVRIAIDIGGTFTDVVAECDGRQSIAKVLTTPGAPEKAVLEGVAAALAAAGAGPDQVSLVIHGTTLATNALIERKGARTALLTTAGFRDTVELGTESRFEQYDVNLEKPPPLVPRNWRLPVTERIAADGEILRPLDEASLLRAAEILRSEKIESVAVGFLHSYANPAHELRVRSLLQKHLPGLPVSLSCEVSPEMREYERFSTTCANAYVQPLVAGYLARLEAGLKAAGFGQKADCPLYLMISSGGITTLETARAFPIRLVESGPAGGAIFAREIAARHDADRVLSFDMGGTTAKVCLIDDFQPQGARVFEVARSYRFRKGSGMPVRVPVIEMVEIGAGGGSIARRDRLGRILVGPDSAGSDPGPACYARGGSAPTVTDADLVLGRIDPGAFAGGRVPLDPGKAHSAVGDEDFAYAVAELVDEAMANAARVHAVESGKTLEERTIIAFGGAAPLHAGRVADKLGASRILVPPGAGVGSAVGFLLAPVSYEVARSHYARLDDFAPGKLNAVLEAMAAEARAVVARGAPGQALLETRTAYARYVGQGHEIAVEVPQKILTEKDATVLRGAFESAYLAQYGRLIEGIDIEILTWTVTVRTSIGASREVEAIQKTPNPDPTAWREVFDVGEARRVRTAIYRRSDLPPGAAFSGPAIIVEDATSTVVGPGFDAMIAADSTIVISRKDRK
jgi:N-methylhydantoinase A